jgi:hypothetical protein
MGARWFLQEYFCQFSDLITALFREENLQAALDSSIVRLPHF